MIYFTSDLHLGHENIIKSCDRPFSNKYTMNYFLIENWKKTVKITDEVYILGDLFWDKESIDIIKLLHGRKYLIIGNHEKNWLNYYLKNYDNEFEWIKDYHVLKYNKKKYVLFHYPIYNWDGKWRNSYHLYGHVHNRDTEYKMNKAYNVGVDVNNLKPVSIEFIEKYFCEKESEEK